MNKISRALLGAALLAVTGLVSAATVVNVDAVKDSLGDTAGVNTGVFLTSGQAFTVSVPTDEIWTNGVGVPGYYSNADGHSNQGIYVINGFSDYIGSLVGEINGTYFNVGTAFSGTAVGTGELKLFFFDTDSFNNGGNVTATISAVPEPANLALMGLALGAFALSRRRKA